MTSKQTNMIDELSEWTANMDEDQAGEFYCLVLEGMDPAQAARESRAADDGVNRARCAGPRSGGDIKNGHGQHVLISDGAEWRDEQMLGSFTLDKRTDVEKEHDWLTWDWVRSVVAKMPERHARTLTVLYGLDTGAPASYEVAAHELGIKRSSVDSARQNAMEAFRIAAGYGESERAKEKRRRKNERARERYRSYTSA